MAFALQSFPRGCTETLLYYASDTFCFGT